MRNVSIAWDCICNFISFACEESIVCRAVIFQEGLSEETRYYIVGRLQIRMVVLLFIHDKAFVLSAKLRILEPGMALAALWKVHTAAMNSRSFRVNTPCRSSGSSKFAMQKCFHQLERNLLIPFRMHLRMQGLKVVCWGCCWSCVQYFLLKVFLSRWSKTRYHDLPFCQIFCNCQNCTDLGPFWN